MHSQLLPTIGATATPGNEDECGDGLLVDEEREDFSEKINLDLGIGNEGGLKRDKEIKQEKEELFFTAAQYNEFSNQILVYNSIISGLTVPFHLFLPIWMSVFSSFGPDIYEKYPSFIGFSSQNFDHISMMDPEPGRCRRTDGRKWRCSKSVIPNQKYCERHMHRGRQGSRKHVEPIQSNKISDDNGMRTISSVASEMDNRIPSSVQSDIDPSQPCSNYNNGVVLPATVKCRSRKNRDALLFSRTTIDERTLGNEVNKNINFEYATTSTSVNYMNNGATNGSDHGEKSGFENANPRKISRRKHSLARNNYMGFVSPEFGSSPKSVLHCGTGKVDLSLSSKNVIETERQRCRRTDGKKWQCRRDAILDQKYCEVHMHRGAKRLTLNAEPLNNFPATSARRGHIPRAIARSRDSGINLNTMPASPEHINGNNSTSSSSDATTITDENISFCLSRSLRSC